MTTSHQTMRIVCLSLWLLPLLLLLPAGGELLAGGPELTAQGARAVGRGGSVVTSTDDVTAVEHNPAALTRIRGTAATVSFSPTRTRVAYRRAPIYDWSRATETQPPPPVHYDTVTNSNPWFPAAGAFAGVASDLGMERLVVALAAYGPTAAGHVIYPDSGAQRFQLVERETILAYYTLAAAYQFTDTFSLGLSLHLFDLARNRMSLVVDADNQTSTVYAHRSPYEVLVSLDTSDRRTFSATSGMLWRPHPRIDLGLAGRMIPVAMEAHGTLEVEPTGTLLRGNTITTWRRTDAGLVQDNSASITAAFAPTAKAGMRYIHPCKTTGGALFDLELNLIWEGWRVYESYQVSMPDVVRVEEMGMEVDLSELMIGRNWKDVYGARLGGQMNILPGMLALRAGAFYETGATPQEYTYLDFLSFNRMGLGGGLSFWRGSVRLDLAYMRIFNQARAVSEDEGKMFILRPGQSCQHPYTGDGCDPYYAGQPGAVSNAGTYLSAYDVVSVGLQIGYR